MRLTSLRSLLVIMGAVLALHDGFGERAYAQTERGRTVLTVHWSAEDFPSTPIVDAAIKQAVLTNAGVPIDYFAEYLESDRFPTPAASAAFVDYIRRKYADRHIDVVLAVSNPALEFVLQHRSDLFPGVPVVTSVSAVLDARSRTEGAGVTGIVGGVAYDKTLELALRMHPSTKRVFVVAYAPTVRMVDIVRPVLQSFSSRVELTYLEEQRLDPLLAAIRAVPPDSLILYIRYSREEQGSVLYPSDVASRVAEVSPVPVYGSNDSYIGLGVVGGVVTSREWMGTRLGQMARQIMNGKRAQDMPMEPVPLTPTLDWRLLTRWGIDEALLPSGTDLRFRQATPWERYRGYVLGVGALIVLQSTLIGALLVQQARRRRAEAALRESEARFRIMADTAPVMIWRAGLDQQRDFFNRPWLTFTGRRLDQELGHGWADSVHPDDRGSCLETFRRSFNARAPFRMEYRFRRFDGEYRVMLDTGVPRWETGGTFAGYIGSCLDITDRQQAELALQETHAELSRVSRLTALGEFAASIAHEVRQPLTAIIINARTCLRGIAGPNPDLEEVKAGLLDVVTASQRAEEVIKRNRELFRHHRVETTSLDINEVIGEVITLVAARLRDNQVALVTHLADNLPPVSGDRIELQQVLLNLIANGIDAMERIAPESRRIDVSSSATSDQFVRVTVSDRGAGFEGVDVERMFTLSYTTKAAGTGVGLSVSRSIVEAHGGRLWAEPNPGGGATFCFTIPERSRVAAAS